MPSTGLPSYDFYQNPTHITLSVYLKGYGVEGLKEEVKVDFEERKVTINLPPLLSGQEARIVSFDPLFDTINSEGSTSRVLNTKIEIRLAKSNPINWSTILSDPSKPSPSPTTTSNVPSNPGPSSSQNAGPSSSSSTTQIPSGNVGGKGEGDEITDTKKNVSGKNKTKNWDKLLEDELDDEKEDGKDPNAGGDQALQKFFSQIYGNADPDTRRAMIKSFTESGGTTLSTDWNSIGKETTPVRPPEGMEHKKM